jgi:hypothetical protein
MFSLGTFQQILKTKKFKKKKKKKRLLCAFVCPSWFKETGGLHSVRRSRSPLVGKECLRGKLLVGTASTTWWVETKQGAVEQHKKLEFS